MTALRTHLRQALLAVRPVYAEIGFKSVAMGRLQCFQEVETLQSCLFQIFMKLEASDSVLADGTVVSSSTLVLLII